MFTSPILHIEDEDAPAYLLQAALNQARVCNRTFRVSSGEDGLAFLLKAGPYQDAQSPGLVFLDLNLPRLDGFAVLSAMRRREELRTIPVVVLSSSESEADRYRVMHLGAHQYVVKQSSVSAMRRAIMGACSQFIEVCRQVLEAAGTFTLRAPSIAYERTVEGGAHINLPTIVPEGSQLQIISTEAPGSTAHVRFGNRDLWIPVHDLRERTCASKPAVPPLLLA